jgi:hypothetical protein
MSNGHAVRSDRRCTCVSMSNLVFVWMYPACANAGDKIIGVRVERYVERSCGGVRSEV